MSAGGIVAVSAVIRDLGFALTLGALVVLATVVRPGSEPADRVARLARAAAIAWAASAVAFAIVSYWWISLTPPSAPTFGVELGSFLTEVPLGQVYLQMAIAALLGSVAVAFVRTPTQAAWALAPLLWAAVVQALTGHVAGNVDHHVAMSSAFLHLMGASLWLGVLTALVISRRALADGAKAMVQRGSTILGWAAFLILISGVANSAVRLTGIGDLWGTPYGRVLSLKVMLFAGLIALGVWHRRFFLPRLSDAQVRERFWRIVMIDVGAMVAIVMIAVVLSHMAPPLVPTTVTDPSPAWMLTGYPLPPAPTFTTWFSQWRFELMTGLAIASAAVVYGLWVRRLRARGDQWSVLRTASWFLGLAILTWVTQGGPAVYGLVTFSGHMLQHMFLVMVVPVFLALGAPATLAFRALPSRRDDSRGPREWLRAFLESRFLRFLAHPVVAAVNFAGSMFVFYYTPVFGWVLRNHIGHVGMALHFVAVGYFLVNALIGVDPGPKRPPYPFRLILLFATMAFHAFFGVALMNSTELLVPRWFGLMGRTWGPDALFDQQWGGQVAWGIGELPVLLLAIGVVAAWRRDETRATRRLDRQADRDHDAELNRYNAMLATLERRDSADGAVAQAPAAKNARKGRASAPRK